MSKTDKPIEGEVINSKSKQRQRQQNKVYAIKINKFTAVLIAILAICVLAFVLKFMVGFLAVILQFFLLAAALAVIGLLIYNLIKGIK